MKRTPLKRKTPLKSKKRLKSKTPLKAKKGLKRTGFKPGPSKRMGRATHYCRDKADRLWQQYMFKKWGHRCAICHKSLKYGRAGGAGHHLVRREVLHLRHHPDNGILLCDKCHNHAKYAPHQSAVAFEKILEDRFPQVYAWLEEHRYEEGKKPDYDKVCARLEELLYSA